jgi:energy-coupling factor transporter ATP-binding protein EcfA2
VKITKVEIKHFRGFPGPAVYTFDLPGGKNLLLYGENGSGKSSLYHALDQLFNIDSQAPPFSELANLFGKDENDQDVADGHVTVYLDDRPPISLSWPQSGVRPTSPILIDAAMRKGFLEYRSLLRTNFVESSLEDRLFQLAVEVLLARILIPLGGTPRTVGENWKDVHTPATHYPRDLRPTEDAINQFNQAFKAVLPDIERKATELLDYFAGHHLKLQLEFDDLIYNKQQRRIENQALRLRVEFNSISILRHETLLNEARLSALALALYLASVLSSNPAPGGAVPDPLKLLVLDDVLIGLDLSNRLPLLEILEKHFGDFQVILSTYDRVWFELAHLQTLSSGKWSYAELFSNWLGDPGYEIPVLKTDQGFIKQAKAHYTKNDYRAAAVYARAAFESKLKNFCSDRRLLVHFHADPRQVSSQDLWSATVKAKRRDGTLYVDNSTKANIEALRKVVLNPLNHAGASSITKAEVEAAIKAVEGLSFT